MRNLIAIPVIILAVILQSAVVSRVVLLSGYADLPLVMLAAWALHENVETAWHWAVATGLLVGFVSDLPIFVTILGYVVVVALAKILQRRVWQAPLLAMFSVTFLGTIFMNLLSLIVLRLLGVSFSIGDALGLLTLPTILLNLLLSIPVFAVMNDLARWMYSAVEVE
ncbi:MAG TPA: rod shape-determining protein MreD [Anaerolineales bacterium]|nr:rod shape-determining protein MreD [Anaerolineales bacterium]